MEFEKFENKSDAIGTSGIDDRITKMIKNWYCSGETILVGKCEHKLAIETELVSLSTLFLLLLVQHISMHSKSAVYLTENSLPL